jgi:hypothetical protein
MLERAAKYAAHYADFTGTKSHEIQADVDTPALRELAELVKAYNEHDVRAGCPCARCHGAQHNLLRFLRGEA